MSVERTWNLCQDNRIKSIQGEGDCILSPRQGEETEWGVTLLERQFFHDSLTILQKLVTMFDLGYIVKDVCRVINLERQRNYLSLGQRTDLLCYQYRKYNVSLGAKFGHVTSSPL